MTRTATDAQYKALSKIVDSNYRETKGDIREIQEQIGKVINLEEPLKRLANKTKEKVRLFSNELENIAEMKAGFKEIKEKDEEVNNQLNTQLELINNNTKELQDQINENLSQESEHFSTVKNLIEKMEGNFKQLLNEQIQKALSSSKKYTDENFSEILEKVNTLETNQTSLNERVTAIETNLAEKEEIIDKIDKNLKKFAKRYETDASEAAEQQENVQNALKTLSEKINDLQKQISENLDLQTSDGKRITEIEKHNHEADTEFSEFKQETELGITECAKEIKKAKSSIKACNTKNEEQDKLLTEHTEQMEVLNEKQETFIQSANMKINGCIKAQEDGKNAMNDFQKVIDAFKERVSNDLKDKDEEFAAIMSESKNTLHQLNKQLENQKKEISSLVSSEIHENDAEIMREIEETKQKVDKIDNFVGKMNSESISGIANTILEIQEKTNKLQKAIDASVEESVNRIKKSQGKMITEIKNTEAALTAMIETKNSDSVEQLASEVETLKTAMEEIQGDVNERRVSLESSFTVKTDKIKEKIAETSGMFDELGKEINALKKELKGAYAKFDTLQEDHNTDIEHVYKDMKKVKRLVDSVKGEIEKGDDAVKGFVIESQRKEEEDIKKVNAFVSEVKGLVLDVVPKYKQTEEEIKGTNDSINNLEAKFNKQIENMKSEALNANSTYNNEMNKRINKIEENFSAITGDSRLDLPKIFDAVKEIKLSHNKDYNYLVSQVNETRIIVEKVKENGNVLVSTLDESNKSLDKFKDQLTNDLKETIEQLNEKIRDKNKSMKNKMTEVTDKFAKFIGTESRTLPEIIEGTENVHQELRDRITNQRTFLTEELKTFKEIFDAFKGDIKENEAKKAAESEEFAEHIKSKLAEFRSFIENSAEQRKKEENKLQKQIYEMYEKTIAPLDDSISALETRVSTLEFTEGKLKSKTQKKFDKILMEFNEQISAIESLNKRNASSASEEVTTNAENIKKLNQKVKELDEQSKDLEKGFRDIRSIKIYTKELEQFRSRFDELISSFSYFKDNITELIIPQMQGVTCTGDADESDSDDSYREAAAHAYTLIKKETPSLKSEFVEIEAEEGDEIGRIIRENIEESPKILIYISEGVKVHWDRRVILKPFQAVKIVGEGSKSIIQMNGGTTVNKYFDPSRAVVDSLSALAIDLVRIEANIATDKIANSPGRGAIFVGNSIASQGPILINITRSHVITTHPLVNVGSNAFMSVSVDGSKIENMDPDSKNISPVVTESGGFGEGWAVVSSDDTRLRGKGIDWCDSKRIITSI